MSVTRTIDLEDLTPAEMAEIFSRYFADEQAEFFNALWELGKDWPGAGWCMQSSNIVPELNEDGKRWLETFFAHFADPLTPAGS